MRYATSSTSFDPCRAIGSSTESETIGSISHLHCLVSWVVTCSCLHLRIMFFGHARRLVSANLHQVDWWKPSPSNPSPDACRTRTTPRIHPAFEFLTVHASRQPRGSPGAKPALLSTTLRVGDKTRDFYELHRTLHSRPIGYPRLQRLLTPDMDNRIVCNGTSNTPR
jgi:hypothetical protein